MPDFALRGALRRTTLFACATAFAPAPCPAQDVSKPTIYVVGDSTANNRHEGARGWGNVFADLFDLSEFDVVNRARGGRSSRTYTSEGLWKKLHTELKEGDIVLLQFGHNDGGSIFEGKARGSLPGVGKETRDGELASGKKETVHSYGHYMRRFVEEARAKGAVPIVLSCTVRNIWKSGRVERGPSKYGAWAREVAKRTRARFLDVTEAIADVYEILGKERVASLFQGDHTHTSPIGARLNAYLIAEALSDAVPAVRKARVSAKHAIRGFALTEPRSRKRPTLWLIGDSTVRNGVRGDGSNGEWGWGSFLAPYFDKRRVDVVNRAIGGLSSRSYRSLGYWAGVCEFLKPGDFVVLQFGHNDSGPLDDAKRARGTIRGTSDKHQDVDNKVTGRRERVHSYGYYLRSYIAETLAHGATPIVCSPVPRKIWRENKIARGAESYAGWARSVAKDARVPCLDLAELLAARYETLGKQAVDELFADAHTHTNEAGAKLSAEVVARELAAQRLPLAELLRKPLRTKPARR